jgi:hypothetical protein
MVKRLVSVRLAALLTTFVCLPVAAEELQFASDPGPALNIARALLSAERGEPLRDDEIVSIALVDLDNDGRRDIFAFADANYFCGSAGCIPRLYRLADGTSTWSELPLESDAMLNAEPSAWSVGEADASGWRTLRLKTEILTLSFGWTGEAYAN